MGLGNGARRQAAFAFILGTVLLDMLALGLLVPVLPKLVVELSGGQAARGAAVFGLFGTAWALAQFVASPVLGALSDRFGRRPVVLLSNLGQGLDYLVMAIAPSLAWLFLGRIVSGVTSASYGAASAYVADVTPPEERAAKFGLLGASFGVGFILGPALGGLLGAASSRLPFWVAAGLCFANFAYGLLVLPESLSPERRTPFRWKAANPLASLSLLRSAPGLLGLAIADFVGFVAHASLPSVWVLYTGYRYHWDARAVGIAMAVVGASSMVVQAALVQPVNARLGDRRTLLFGYLCGVAGFVTFGLAPTGAAFLVGIPLMGLWGLAGPATQSLMTAHVASDQQGQLQGASGSYRGIAELVGPGLFTLTFAAAVEGRLGGWVGAPYLVAAGLVAIATAIAWRLANPAPSPAPATVVELA